MAVKVCIIDVDLGISIEQLIAESAEELTSNTQKELDQAIELAKASQKIKLDRDQVKKETDVKFTTRLQEAYDMILQSGDQGVPVSMVIAKVNDIIATPASFTARFKAYLNSRGNEYILDRKQVHGTPHYTMKPFNKLI